MLRLEWNQAILKFHGDEITSNLRKQSPAVSLWGQFYVWAKLKNPSLVLVLQLPFVQEELNMHSNPTKREIITYTPTVKVRHYCSFNRLRNAQEVGKKN